jgi:hypothetical protein
LAYTLRACLHGATRLRRETMDADAGAEAAASGAGGSAAPAPKPAAVAWSAAVTTFTLAALALLAAAPIQRGLPTPLPGHPGHVWLRGESVALDAPTAEGAVGWQCLDYEHKTVSQGAGAHAELGALSVGYYELWAVDAAGKPLRKTTLGVLEPLAAPTPLDSPVCVDAATTWFYARQPSTAPIDIAAEQCALAGVNWVRDRLSWDSVEPARGTFADHTPYDDAARIMSAAGLQVLQVFHSSPAWATKQRDRVAPDLRDVYTFTKTMSARWHGQVRAWEPWNEGDIEGFGGQSGLELATWQKAAYFGLRAGDPDALVCHNVFATWHTPLMDDITANDAASYCDTFNFHHYMPTDAFIGYYKSFRDASGGRPLWVSEAGTHISFRGDKTEAEPSWPEQIHQARFVPQCFAASLAEGCRSMFFFLLPNYIEGDTQFGLTHHDRSPRPGYLALAAAGRLLAGAQPDGRILPGSKGNLRLYRFRAKPAGQACTIAVAWSMAGETDLPADIKVEAAWDLLGRSIAPPAKVTADPVYLQLAAEGAPLPMPAAAPAPSTALPPPCPLVLQPLLPSNRLLVARSAYRLEADAPTTLPVFAYNFGDQPLTATVTATADAGLLVSPASAQVKVAPMERVELTFQVSVDTASPHPGPRAVTFRAQPDAVASMRFVAPLLALPNKGTVAVPGADDPKNWKTMNSPGTMSLSAAEGGGVLVEATLKEGDRWVYPFLPIAPEARPAGFDGVAFTIVPLEGQAVYRVIVDKENASNYLTDVGFAQPLELGKPLPAYVRFADLAWGAFSPTDPEGKITPGQIAVMKIGCNTRDARVRYIIRNVRWVK